MKPARAAYKPPLEAEIKAVSNDFARRLGLEHAHFHCEGVGGGRARLSVSDDRFKGRGRPRAFVLLSPTDLDRFRECDADTAGPLFDWLDTTLRWLLWDLGGQVRLELGIAGEA